MGIEAFSPAMLEAWNRAAYEDVWLPCEQQSVATTLRHRFYKLRAEMRRVKHPYSANAERVKIQKIKKDDKWFLLMTRTDADFENILSQVPNISVPDPVPLDDPMLPPPPPLDD